MKLSETMAKAVAEQITLELEASVVYLQLAIQLDGLDLTGMGSWMRSQAEEEQVHAAKFIEHSVDRDAPPQIGTINAPNVKATTALGLFEAALAHEQKVSEAIRSLYRAAQNEGDLDIVPLLNWFIDEQVEEEASVGEIVGQLKLIGEDGSGLLRMDSQLGSRIPEIKASNE